VSVTLERPLFSINRANEYFDIRELQAQTGQEVENFASVILKELRARSESSGGGIE
jgi:hypothetical protein